MAKQLRFFAVSDDGLDHREIRYFKTRVLGSGTLVALLAIGLTIGINHISGDPLGLGIGQMSIVRTENQILKNQIKDLSERIAHSQLSLDALYERGNQLRLLVDLKGLDNDERKASTGGATSSNAFSYLSRDASTLLKKSSTQIEGLEKEIELQRTSYEAILKKYETNKDLFARIPAIKPSVGHYTVNGFGMRIHPVLRVPRLHEGVDIITEVGENVYASGDGVVSFSGRTGGGYGIVVELSHGYGYTSLYAHLSRPLVHDGQKVKRGDLIGKTGRTGLVSGPHLHYEVRYNGRSQNPVDYFFDDIDAARYRAQLAAAERIQG